MSSGDYSDARDRFSQETDEDLKNKNVVRGPQPLTSSMIGEVEQNRIRNEKENSELKRYGFDNKAVIKK
jgi:hypothetical protein